MQTTKRLILLLFLLISLVLGACSGAAPVTTQAPAVAEQATPTEQPPTPTQAPSNTPAPTKTPEPSPTPEPIVITDSLGREMVLDTPAQKIISLAPSNTEILFAIGAGSQVVARDAFSDFPEQAQKLADIGGGWGEINTESLLALSPDLVLAAEINAVEQVETLEDLGLKVFYLANPTELEGMYENLRIVARLTGREQETEALVASLQERVAAIDALMANVENRPLVFYELDGTDANAPWTSGPGTFIDLLVERAGGTNLGGSLDSAWAQISVEDLIIRDPDIILLGDAVWGGVTAESVEARSGWDAIAAVKNQQIYPFDDNLVSRPGPRMVDGLEALAKLFHPDLFP